MNQALSPASTAGLGRRALALIYEILLLAAVLLAGALPLLMLMQNADAALVRLALQLFLPALCGVYYIWQWLHGGQTLPMKTWRVKLIARDGGPLTVRHGLYRYLFALAGFALLGSGFLWALFDRDRQFLHDRLAGTKIINVEK